MSKQTALTKAIEQINQFHVKYDHLDNMLISKDDVLKALTDLLPYEREVIEQIYEDVDDDRISYHAGEKVKYHNSTDYFTQTFTDNGK